MRVAVIGGGVAGAAAAIALRGIGAEVTCFEAYADPSRGVGAFLSLASNGVRGLAALGCLDRVRERGFEVERQLMWADTGKLMGNVARGRVERDPTRSITIMRGQLVTAMREAAVGAGATLVTDA